MWGMGYRISDLLSRGKVVWGFWEFWGFGGFGVFGGVVEGGGGREGLGFGEVWMDWGGREWGGFE